MNRNNITTNLLHGLTALINIAEQALRFSFGLAMIGAAPLSRFPDAFQWIGLFIAATSLLILLVPRRWHHGYAVWWADTLHPVVVRLLAPISPHIGRSTEWNLPSCIRS